MPPKPSFAPRLRAFATRHEDALRIAGRVGVAATLGFGLASLLHLRETYWPVLSAVIVARGGAKGSGGSAADRLVGTLAGAATGLAASFLHHLGLPDWLLLFIAMAPLAFVSVDQPAFRAAPMAAMIVLSASTAGASDWEGLRIAFGRVLDVGMGAAVALFVAYVLIPSDAMRALRRDAAALMTPIANLLALAVKPADEEARKTFVKLTARTRRDLRDLVIAARQIRPRKEEREAPDTLPNQFATALGRTHGTIVFIARALAGGALAEDVSAALRPVLRAARARLGAIDRALRGEAQVETFTDLAAAISAALSRIQAHAADNPAVHLEAMPFLLQTLGEDLEALASLAAELPGARAGEAAAPRVSEAADRLQNQSLRTA